MKDSVWTYHHQNGKVSLSETYFVGLLLKSECYDTSGKLENNCDSTFQLPKSKYNASEFLAKNLRMPREAIDAHLYGQFRVTIGFVVDLDGTVTSAHIVQGSYAEFNEEVLRVIKQLPKWQPARCQNRYIRAYYTLPITFRIE